MFFERPKDRSQQDPRHTPGLNGQETKARGFPRALVSGGFQPRESSVTTIPVNRPNLNIVGLRAAFKVRHQDDKTPQFYWEEI